jgi:alcohol oxidase
MAIALLYTRSRGYIHITSPDDIYAPPDLDPGFLSDPADVPPQRWAYKVQREIFRRMSLYRGEWAPSHPRFPAESPAAVKPYDPSETIKDYVYTVEDDAAIDRYVRQEATSMYHPM